MTARKPAVKMRASENMEKREPTPIILKNCAQNLSWFGVQCLKTPPQKVVMIVVARFARAKLPVITQCLH